MLWGLCKSMKWTHLPVDGGLFDQDPIMLQHWSILWRVEGQVRKEDADKAKSGSAGSGPKGGRATMGGRALKSSGM